MNTSRTIRIKRPGSNDDNGLERVVGSEQKPEQESDVSSMQEYRSNLKKKIRRGVIGTVAGLAALVVGFSSLYKIQEYEQAVVTRLGKPVKVIVNSVSEDEQKEIAGKYREKGLAVSEGAGIYVKMPFIDSVTKIDRRYLRWNGYPEQIPTLDKKLIWVDSTARWRITDPLVYMESVRTEDQAQARLDDTIDPAVRNNITKRGLIEIVRNSNRDMQVTEEMRDISRNVPYVNEGRNIIIEQINEEAAGKNTNYGLEVSGVMLRGLTYVREVKESVEQRMISERERIAEKFRSEGNGEYERIMGEKERDHREIISEAYKQAQAIRGEAEKRAIEIYANGFSVTDTNSDITVTYQGFNADPQFYEFMRQLQVYDRSLTNGNVTAMLGDGNKIFGLLKGDTATSATLK
ncbi:protease modulator HflC [Candidatus Woesearchaeota archaeon]|nr:protease modulator HflC [Candidatus Woesearchaeota archaeon]